MSGFTVNIEISEDDVVTLKAMRANLYVFKAVSASGAGAVTCWSKFASKEISTSLTLNWQEQYTAYNSTDQLKDGNQINPGNSSKIVIGQKAIIDLSGNLSVSTAGLANVISFVNNAANVYTIGLISLVGGINNVGNAFAILGTGGARILEPANKVALIVSPAHIDVNTIVDIAPSSGVIVDMNGASNGSRNLGFSVSKGWNAFGGTWIDNFSAYVKLSTLLISAPTHLINLASKLRKEEL